MATKTGTSRKSATKSKTTKKSVSKPKKPAGKKATAKKVTAAKKTAAKTGNAKGGKKTAPGKAEAKKKSPPKSTARKSTVKKAVSGKKAPVKKTVRRSRKPSPVLSSSEKITKKDLEYFRQFLFSLRSRITNSVHFLTQDSLQPMQSKEEDPDGFDHESALRMAGNEQELLLEIDEALMRIDHGTYGICEQTGKPIGKGRLKAIPYARLCIEAQALQERGRIRVHSFDLA